MISFVLGKEYNGTTAEKFRLKIYMENRARIAKHNHRANQGQHSYYLKMNHFGDMVNEGTALHVKTVKCSIFYLNFLLRNLSFTTSSFHT